MPTSLIERKGVNKTYKVGDEILHALADVNVTINAATSWLLSVYWQDYTRRLGLRDLTQLTPCVMSRIIKLKRN
jgi:hypothetical protein